MQAAVMPLQGDKKLKKATLKVFRGANNDIRSIYFAGLSSVIKGTPVDKGRARNNWFLSVGASSNDITTSESVNGDASQAQLNHMPKNVLNKKVYFTNNLPYIRTLEYGGYPDPVKKGTYNKKTKAYEIRSISGFSKQVAPRGWVRVRIIAMRKKIRAL